LEVRMEMANTDDNMAYFWLHETLLPLRIVQFASLLG
jgi:hypothetical protein